MSMYSLKFVVTLYYGELKILANISANISSSAVCENKGADQRRSADRHLCFHYSGCTDSMVSLLSKSKTSSSNYLLCLFNLVCVKPALKPHCWLSHQVALMVA